MNPYHEGYLAASAARITNGCVMHVQSNPYSANSPAFRAYLDGIIDCARDKAERFHQAHGDCR